MMRQDMTMTLQDQLTTNLGTGEDPKPRRCWSISHSGSSTFYGPLRADVELVPNRESAIQPRQTLAHLVIGDVARRHDMQAMKIIEDE